MSVEKSERNGVGVEGSKRNSMKNCNVSHSQWNGVYVRDGLMKIDGSDTAIHHNNVTSGHSDCCGLFADSSSSIFLASSLTIKMISKNNGGGNQGGRGTIKTITKERNNKT